MTWQTIDSAPKADAVKVTPDDIAELLSEGLDLCVRAKKLDEAMTLAAAAAQGWSKGGTNCLTPALWIQDQYDRDLNDWQERARAKLTAWMFAHPGGFATETPRKRAISAPRNGMDGAPT